MQFHTLIISCNQTKRQLTRNYGRNEERNFNIDLRAKK